MTVNEIIGVAITLFALYQGVRIVAIYIPLITYALAQPIMSKHTAAGLTFGFAFWLVLWIAVGTFGYHLAAH